MTRLQKQTPHGLISSFISWSGISFLLQGAAPAPVCIVHDKCLPQKKYFLLGKERKKQAIVVTKYTLFRFNKFKLQHIYTLQ